MAEPFNKVPQRIGKQRRGHTRSRYFADEDHVSTVLLRALRKPVSRLDMSSCGLTAANERRGDDFESHLLGRTKVGRREVLNWTRRPSARLTGSACTAR